MTQSWSLSTLPNGTATVDLVQLFPAFVTPGTGSVSPGTLIRKTTEGVLYRCDVTPSDGSGGYIELWDVAGKPYGASNNINTGNALTDAYLTEQQGKGEAKLLWRSDFKGDSGLTTKTFATRLTFTYGLAARYVNTLDAAGTKNVTLNIVAEGGYIKYEYLGA